MENMKNGILSQVIVTTGETAMTRFTKFFSGIGPGSKG